MRLTFIVLLAVGLLLLAASAEAKRSSGVSKKKVEKGSQKEPESTSDSARSSKVPPRMQEVGDLLPYTYISDKNFTRYIVDRPRDYHAVIMFTATAKQYQCSVCHMALKGFVEGAKAYHDGADFMAGADAAFADSTARLEAASKRVAFFVLEVDQARSVFDDMGLESVPRIYALPPTQEGSPKMRMQDFDIPVQVMVNGAQSFLKAVSEKTGVSMEAKTRPAPALLVLCIVAYVLAWLATNASKDPSAALLWYRAPGLWVSVSTICFCVGVSGSIFCVIRSPPWYGNDFKNGSLHIFAGQGREQYVLEGLLIALMAVLCGASAMVAYKATKMQVGTVMRHALVLAALAAFVTLATQLAEIYMFKTGWYRIQETMPPAVWDWLKGSVRKSSGLPKRILRLSEYWMYEFKDWGSFGKKTKSLLVDFLFRGSSTV